MKSIIDDYIQFVIKPLEDFQKCLLGEYQLSFDDPLIQKIEKDLVEKYERLSDLLDNL